MKILIAVLVALLAVTSAKAADPASYNSNVVGQKIYGSVLMASPDGTNAFAVSPTNPLPTSASISGGTMTVNQGATGGSFWLTYPQSTVGAFGTATGYGDMAAGAYNSTLTVLTTGQAAGLQLDSTGRLLTGGGSTGSSASISMTGSSVAVIAANPSRLEVHVGNNSGLACHYAFGNAASATTLPLAVGQVLIENIFKGAINVLCASGTIAVSEVTP